MKLQYSNESESINQSSNDEPFYPVVDWVNSYKPLFSSQGEYSFTFSYRHIMNSKRAPRQWSLKKNETITTFEASRQNLQYSFSLDVNFAPFLADNFTWLKKSSTAPNRGLKPDGDNIPTTRRHTAFRKNLHPELMLGQIANFCPVISRSLIMKNSTSIRSVWQAIRVHYGFQSTSARFLDFSNIKREVDERPKHLFQWLMSFTEDNLLVANSPVTHHGAHVTSDEELTPTLERVGSGKGLSTKKTKLNIEKWPESLYVLLEF